MCRHSDAGVLRGVRTEKASQDAKCTPVRVRGAAYRAPPDGRARGFKRATANRPRSDAPADPARRRACGRRSGQVRALPKHADAGGAGVGRDLRPPDRSRQLGSERPARSLNAARCSNGWRRDAAARRRRRPLARRRPTRRAESQPHDRRQLTALPSPPPDYPSEARVMESCVCCSPATRAAWQGTAEIGRSVVHSVLLTY